MRDYDGFISQWNTFHILPPNIQEFADLILDNTEGNITELGSGNGLLAAGLSFTNDGRFVQAIDLVQPVALGDYSFLCMDGNSAAFFETIKNETNLVGRRSLCLFFTPEWMDMVEKTAVKTIISQALDSEMGHVLRNAELEAAFLERRGWKTGIKNGHHVIATRD